MPLQQNRLTQLFTCGMLFSDIQDVGEHAGHINTSIADLDVNSVVIPSTFNPLSVQQSSELASGDYGIETYSSLKSIF